MVSDLAFARHVPLNTSVKMSPFPTGYSPPLWLLGANISIYLVDFTLEKCTAQVEENFTFVSIGHLVALPSVATSCDYRAIMSTKFSSFQITVLCKLAKTKFNMDRWYRRVINSLNWSTAYAHKHHFYIRDIEKHKGLQIKV